MPAEQQLERSVLERKEREELRAIAQAMSLQTTSRSKKADIIDLILRAAGVEVGDTVAKANGSTGGARTRRPASSSADAGVEAAGDTTSVASASTNGAATKLPESLGSGSENGSSGPPADTTDRANGTEGGKNGGDVAGSTVTAIAESSTETSTPSSISDDRTGSRQPARQPAPQVRQGPTEAGSRRSRRRRGRERPERVGGGGTGSSNSDRELQSGGQESQYQGELVAVSGLFDLRDEGYGFLRADGYLPSARRRVRLDQPSPQVLHPKGRLRRRSVPPGGEQREVSRPHPDRLRLGNDPRGGEEPSQVRGPHSSVP